MLHVEVHADQLHPPVERVSPPLHPPELVPCPSPRKGADSSPQPSHTGQPDALPRAGGCIELLFE